MAPVLLYLWPWTALPDTSQCRKPMQQLQLTPDMYACGIVQSCCIKTQARYLHRTLRLGHAHSVHAKWRKLSA